jgi:hypothetical protein
VVPLTPLKSQATPLFQDICNSPWASEVGTVPRPPNLFLGIGMLRSDYIFCLQDGYLALAAQRVVHSEPSLSCPALNPWALNPWALPDVQVQALIPKDPPIAYLVASG